MRLILSAALVLLFLPAVGQYHYTLTERCDEAIDLFYKLKLDQSAELLQAERQRDPDNLMPLFLEDYIDFFRIYITEDEALYFELMDQREARLKKLQEGPEDSPFYLYCLAETYLHWAIGRLKFEEYMGAFLNVRKAYQLLEKNQEKFPGFIHNLKSLAVMHAAIGSIPEKYKWGAELLGMEGSVEQGMQELEQLSKYCEENDFPFHPEVRMLEAFLQMHLMKDGGAAWELVSRKDFMEKDDLLAHFVKASIASYTGRNDTVINVVRAAPAGSEYIDLHFMDYLHGMALVRKIDPQGKELLKEYAREFDGRNFIKESWQKVAWMCLLEGDTAGYRTNMDRVLEQGYSMVDEDKAAEAEAAKGQIPHPLLLKARLLSDGGYFDRALQLLRGKSVEDFDALRHRVEFTYRAGRIFQEKGNDERARSYFYATLKNAPKQADYYFAPNASLQLGIMFEDAGDAERAAYYFQKAIDYKGHAYENGIEAKAKTGLKRVEE